MRSVVLSTIAVLLFFGLQAQILEPVRWEMSSRRISGDEYELTFTAHMEDKWTIYSQYTSDDGPVPTSFHFTAGPHYSLMGEVSESGGKKKEGIDPFFKVNVIKFVEGPVVFTQKVKATDPGQPVMGYLEFMTCDDKSCLPPAEVTFSFDLAQAGSTASVSEGDQAQADPSAQIASGSFTVSDMGAAPQMGQGMADPVQWTAAIEKISDQEYEVVFTAAMQEGWTVYSQFIKIAEDEIGPMPTAFYFDKGDHFEAAGEAAESGKKKEGIDPVFEIFVTKYVDEPVSFRQKLNVSDPAREITGFVEYMTCDDKQCLPGEASFRILPAAMQAMIGDQAPPAAAAGSGEFGPIFNENWDNEPVGYCGEEAVTVQGKSYWSIFLLGFVGGLLALLTPCVFPMVPLTVSFFTKGSENRRKGVFNAFTYGFFIFLVYLILSIPFHLMDSIDSGILNQMATEIWLNLIFFAIFIFFAFSFFGFYEITLPSSWTNRASSAEGVGGVLGIFFMALTLALVSFSCTGPILGSLLAGALSSSGGAMQLTVGMGGFGLALALPFALFAAFPTWLSSLPRSGGWLNTVKVVLGFVELALAFKFLSNADLTKHWGILKYEFFLGIWILIALGLVLYLIGKIRFPHDSPLKKLSVGRLVTASVAFAFTVYMALGFIYNEDMGSYRPLKLLSGLVPPSCYSWLHPCDCPQNLDCFKDLEQGLAYARSVNKPVMLDFTGYQCVNCREMEENVWPEEEVYSHLKDDYVLISLYVDDREPATGEDAGKYRYIGKKWHKFQQEYFGANSQPFYVLISPEDGRLLNQPVAFTPDAQEYGAFLRCGLENYKRLTEQKSSEGDKRIGAAE